MSTSKVVTISIIVPSHRSNSIDEFTQAILPLLQESQSVECIIIADYPTEALQKKYPQIQWMYINNQSIPVKRNIGIKKAQGEICGFIDDDCHPSKDWIENACSYLERNPQVVGVEGFTSIEQKKNQRGAYKEFKRLEKQGFRTNNIFYRKDILYKVNLFDERFSFQREDVDLAYSIIKAGHTIAFSKSIMVTHRFRQNEPWDLLKNCNNRRFDPLLYAKHKHLYRKHIGMAYPPGIAALLFSYIILIIIGLVNTQLLFPCSLVVFGLISVLTIRRGGIPFVHGGLQWFRELLSFAVAPFVIFYALLHGSIRFRTLFLL